MARIKSSEMPAFIKPQLAILKAKAPTGNQWLRNQVRRLSGSNSPEQGKAESLYAQRARLDETLFSHCRRARHPGQAIIDGEVVVIYERRTNFSELQAELAGKRQDRLVFYAFDLLWRYGDLRKLPQMSENKRCLICLAKTASRRRSFTANT
jgi:bifunctional non-homologous end joining protein LigD